MSEDSQRRMPPLECFPCVIGEVIWLGVVSYGVLWLFRGAKAAKTDAAAAPQAEAAKSSAAAPPGLSTTRRTETTAGISKVP